MSSCTKSSVGEIDRVHSVDESGFSTHGRSLANRNSSLAQCDLKNELEKS